MTTVVLWLIAAGSLAIAWILIGILFTDRLNHAEAPRLRETLTTIDTLHSPMHTPCARGGVCRECGKSYPCPTVRRIRAATDERRGL